jgi:hypothetical protein
LAAPHVRARLDRAHDARSAHGLSALRESTFDAPAGEPCAIKVHALRVVAREVEIAWNVVPAATQFRDALLRAAPHVASAQEPPCTISYLDVDELDREKRLRELIETGDTLAAIRIVRQIHGCDLAEARRRIDDLRAGTGRS